MSFVVPAVDKGGVGIAGGCSSAEAAEAVKVPGVEAPVVLPKNPEKLLAMKARSQTGAQITRATA